MKWLVNNWPLKLVALVLALVLWFYVSGESKGGIGFQGEKVIFPVPLRLLSPPEEEVEVNFQPDKIRVTLRGTPGRLKKITASDILLFVDVGKLDGGDYELPVQYKVPEGVRVEQIIPGSVKVTLKKEALSQEKKGKVTRPRWRK